jgi:hypothetical protein
VVELVTPKDPGDKEIASRVWGILMGRMTPLQIRVLHRIAQAHPTTSELAAALEVSPQHAGNLAAALYREGFLRRERAGGRQYRWFPAFQTPLPYHYFDRSPVEITDPAMVAHVEGILQRRGKL